MKIQKRRRREHKTDYLKRMKLLKSMSPRIVFRKTNRYVIAQYVETREAQDKVVFGINSKKLIDYGWPKELKNSLKTLPAAYLLGVAVGKKIIKEKLKTPILDLGMLRTVHKTKIYAFLKGVLDSGIEIKHKKSIFPDEEKIKGKNLKKDFSKAFDKIKSKVESL